MQTHRTYPYGYTITAVIHGRNALKGADLLIVAQQLVPFNEQEEHATTKARQGLRCRPEITSTILIAGGRAAKSAPTPYKKHS